MSSYIQAIQGGGSIAARQIAATLISFVTAILLSRLLGPDEFAIYSLCLALTVFLAPISRMGINAWLMSQEKTPNIQVFEIALGGMLVFSISVTLLAVLGLPYLEQFSKVDHLLWPAVLTATLLPLEVLSLPAMTKLERDLDYGDVMRVELVGQFIGQLP